MYFSNGAARAFFSLFISFHEYFTTEMSEDLSGSSDWREHLVLSLLERFKKEWDEVFHLRGLAVSRFQEESTESSSAGSTWAVDDVFIQGRLHEKLMELCFILLCVGDVSGYVTADSTGFVNPVSSEYSFLKGFIQCMQITHVFSLKYLASTDTVKKPWFTTGLQRIHYKIALLDSEYQKVLSTLGAVSPIKCTVMDVPSFDSVQSIALVQSFLDLSDTIFGKAKLALEARARRKIGPVGPSGVGLNACAVRLMRQGLFGMVVVLCQTKSSVFAGEQGERLQEKRKELQFECELECVPQSRNIFEEYMQEKPGASVDVPEQEV